MRKKREIIQDKILLLYLVSFVKNNHDIEGNLKFQKLFFLTEWKLMESGIKALNFKFFRYLYGPFSKELLCDYNELKEKKYLSSLFNLSEKAIDLIDYIHESIKDIGNNSKIIDCMTKTCSVYSKYPGIALTNKVYDMEIEPYDMPDKKMKIKDIPHFFNILVPENFKAETKMEIPEFLIKDIEQEFKGVELTRSEKQKLVEESRNRFKELIFSRDATAN